MSVINLTTENFEEEVLNAKEPVLVDFWATWCGPCQTMGPVVDELAQELTDVKVGKVNVDEQMALAREYKVMSIPTFLVIQAVSLSTPSFIKFFIQFCGVFHCFQIHICSL